jgi:hypothetical protein
VIANKAGAKGTGSDVNPLCRSVVPTATCTNSNLFCTGNPAVDGAGSGCPTGIDVVDNVVGYQAVNPNAQFIQAGFGALANVGRNVLQLDPTNNLDLTVLKRFTITERYKVEFRASASNVLNHAQYIGGYLNDVAPIGFTGFERGFTEPTNAGFNQPSQFFSSNPRQLTLVLKIFF